VLVSFLTVNALTLHGFIGSAKGDGRLYLEVDGAVVLAGQLDAAERTVSAVPEIGLAVDAGKLIELKVDCDAVGLTTFEGTVFTSG